MTTAEDTDRDINLIRNERAASAGGSRAFAPTLLADRLDVPEVDDAGKSHRTGVDVSVVVPLYNEANLVEDCVGRLSEALRCSARNHQIVLVDDGSTDATPGLLDRLAQGDSSLQVIRLPRNMGQQHATLVGMREARGDVVITMDADLPVDAAQIASLLKPLRDDPNCDVASAVRSRRAKGLYRRVGSHAVTAILNRICGTHLKDPGSTFKAMRRHVVRHALQNDILAQNLPLFVAYAGLNIREVPMPDVPSTKRRSSYRPSGLLMTLALAFLNYSSGARALSTLLLLGWGMMSAGAALCAVLIIKGAFYQTHLPTNLLLAGLVTVVFGGQFIAFAFLGYKLELLIRNLRLRGTPLSFHQGGP